MRFIDSLLEVTFRIFSEVYSVNFLSTCDMWDTMVDLKKNIINTLYSVMGKMNKLNK